MRTIFTIISLFFATSAFAQYTITIDAFVLDENTKQPIPYVNIQGIGKDIKTITDASGKFTLTFDEDYVSDTNSFQFITIGYDSLTVEMSKLSKYLNVSNKIYLTATKKESLENTISGTVFSGENTTIQHASVRIKDTFEEVQTSVDGQFEIPAEIGDTLVVDYIGMHDKEMVVSSVAPVKIELKPNAELLKTVLINAKKEKKKSKRYVDTGFGQVDFNSFPLGSVLTSEDIGFHRVYVTDVLRGRIAGLIVSTGESSAGSRFNATALSSYKLSGNGVRTSPGQPILKLRGSEVVVYYDGFPYYGNINEINVNTIDTIVILKSLATTVLYGSQPTILITSKNRFLEKDENGEAINTALVTDNLYTESVPLLSSTTQKSNYIDVLQNAKTYEQALKIYTAQSQNEKFQTVSYYIDASEYFRKWNPEKAISILANIEKIAGNNPKALKSLAYKLEELKQFEHAKLIYQRIATLLPNAAQSYRDLALIYKNTGNYQQSLDLYKKMLANSINNIDFKSLEKPLLSEMQHLLLRYRSEVDYKDLPSNVLTTTFKYDVRIVFEWNTADAEFELQFVNPNSKFYTWEHSIIVNKERMLDEVKNGYHMEEFIIDEAIHTGEWIVNVKNLKEEKALNPTYLKYTIYKNYGTETEERTVKVIELNKQEQKVTIDKIKYQPAQ